MTQLKDQISYIMIAEINRKYYTSTIQQKHHNAFYTPYAFNVKENCKGYFSATQWDDRFYPESAEYVYSPFRFILEKRANGEAKYINSGYSHEGRYLDMPVELTPGSYILYSAIYWQDKERDYIVSFYGEELLKYTKLPTLKQPNLICESL